MPFDVIITVELRSPIGEQDLSMANFAIGDVVKKDKGRTGTVRAIFTTMAGELCYAVEHEGASISLRKPSCRIAKDGLGRLDLNAFVGEWASDC